LKTAVLDASVMGPWFSGPVGAALLAEYEGGELVAHVPGLLFLELLNVAGRQLRWAEDRLQELADRLGRSRVDVIDPELGRVANWVARGLTAYDASYVALAEQLGVPLVTADRAILEIAHDIAIRPDRMS
jgi:predicted nucleic acid-binding protein